MSANQTPLLEALEKKIGRPGSITWLMLLLLLTVVFAPFALCWLAFDLAELTDKLSPVECEELLALANEDEWMELEKLIRESSGRPTKWTVRRLRVRLTAVAKGRADAAALARIVPSCV